MLDFRPDLDPRTAELVTDINEMIPTAKGYRVAYGATAHTAHTYSPDSGEVYPNALFASRWLSTPGGIVIAGTNKKLNVYSYSGGFINVSKMGNYSIGSAVCPYSEDSPASFDLCAFGDVIIACNKAVATQKRSALDLTSSTKFSDLTGAPQANTCCVARNFVFLGDVGNWDIITGSPDILAWSAVGDHTDWAVDPQVTQASYAQFNDTPGAITCVRPFRDGVVVFKGESMYLGRYVGSGNNSDIWDFERISDRIGCLGHRSCTNIDTDLVFIGKDDVYRYDGTRPVSITGGIYETLAPQLNFSGTFSACVGHDRPNNSVWIGGYAATYVWNYKYNRWGLLTNPGPLVDNGTISFKPLTLCQTNADDFRTATLSTVAVGVQSFTISTNHYNIYTLHIANSGQPYNRNTTRSTAAYVYTGAIGQPDKLQTLSRVTPLYNTRPATVGTATLQAYGSRTPGGFSALGSPVPMSAEYRFNMLATTGVSNNFFQLKHACSQDHELIGFDVDPNMKGAGER